MPQKNIKYITNFIRAKSPALWLYPYTFFCSSVGYGRCLTDKPGKNRLLQDTEFQQPPGQLYPRDRQCELVFGPKSTICPYMPECKRLWCTMADTTQGGCRTQHMPWADGTECGDDKVMIQYLFTQCGLASNYTTFYIHVCTQHVPKVWQPNRYRFVYTLPATSMPVEVSYKRVEKLTVYTDIQSFL